MIIAGIVTRLVQGFFKTFIQAPSISMIMITNSNEKVRYMAYIEICLCTGNAIGPVIGSFIYSYLGFLYMFLILGSVFLLYIPLMKFLLPNGIDEDGGDTSELIENQHQDQDNNVEQQIGYTKLLSDPIILMLTITQTLTVIDSWYFEPLLSFRVQEFTDSVKIQGIMFGCVVMGYCTMWFIVPYFAKSINQMYLINLGVLLCGWANFLVGPSKFLPDNIYIMAVGLFLLGVTGSFVYLPQIAIMIERSKFRFPSQARKLSDMWSSIFTGTFSLGLFLGPIYGGYVKEIIGYRNLCTLSAIILVAYSFIFYAVYLIADRKHEDSKQIHKNRSIGSHSEML